MLIVETIARIRRAHFVQGKPIKAICRDLRLSRKVVRKAIRAEEGAFSYQRTTQPFPKIGPVRDRLVQLLTENEARPRRDLDDGVGLGGAAVFLLLENLVSIWTVHWQLIVGAVFVVCVLFFPAGIWGTILKRINK